MDIFSYDLWLILLCLFTINFISLAIIRSNERYWLPSTLLWILLLISLFINITLNKTNVIEKEADYNAQTDPQSRSNEASILTLEAAKKQQSFENTFLFRLVGFQTIMCLLCQLIGYKLTSSIQFKKGSKAFLIFLLLYGVIEMLNREW